MGFVVLVHLSQCLCSNVAAELCGAPRRWGREGPRLPPVPVGTHPLTPMDGGSLRLLYIADVPLQLILLPSVAVFWAVTFFVAISFLVTQRTVGFLHPPHSEEFPAGVLSWDNLFGSKSICFSKQTGFPPQTQCHGKEGLFPMCAELAPLSSKTDKARSTSGEVSWAIRRSMSKSGCSLSIFLPPRYCSLRREQFTFYERSQVLERLNIQHDCGQDKSNLVYLQELKEEMETPDFVGGKEGPCTGQLTRVVLLPGVHAATSDEVGPLCGPVAWGQVAGSSL